MQCPGGCADQTDRIRPFTAFPCGSALASCQRLTPLRARAAALYLAAERGNTKAVQQLLHFG